MRTMTGFIELALKEAPRMNEYGNSIHHIFLMDCDRYHFDFEECSSSKGFKQYDTEQDAWYFGVWVCIEKRMTVVYAEGDLYVTTCPTPESFRQELSGMERAYGDPPPCAIGIDFENKTITKFYDERPK